MPLDGSGTASKPSGTTFAPSTTIESAKMNSLADDIYSIFNTARPITKGGTGATSASAARTALGLAIGSDVQAYNAGLAAIAALTTTAYGRSLLTAADAAALRTLAELVIGTNVQAYDAALASLAGLSLAQGDILYATAADTLARLPKGTAAQALVMNSGATAPEWATPVTASMTLLGTLTTTSGTTQSLTGIAAGYRQLLCELEGVSFTADAQLTVALSSTNGAAYGSAATLFPTTGGASGALSGVITVGNIGSTVAAAKTLVEYLGIGAGTGAGNSFIMATNTAAVVDAIRFAGGTFDAGTIRIYGVK